MAIGDVAAPDAVDLEFDRLVVEQAKDGVQRPDPANAACAPAHGFRPGELADDFGHGLGDDGRRGASGFLGASEIVIALRVFHDLAFIEALQARRAQEAFDRPLRRAHARTFALLDGCGRLRGYALGDENDAPRPRIGLCRVGLEPALRQRLRHHARKVRFRARLHAGRDFF